MDNLTHTMFGVAIAEATFQIYRIKQKEQKPQLSRRSFYTTSIVANNLPDIDLLMNFVDPSTVGYLIHHRGHTHTALWGLPQAAILAGLVFWRVGFSWYLLFLSFFGLFTHMALDFKNSYGVHLWSPFDNRWQYGDTLFIVEPLFWIPTFALIVTTFKNHWLKFVLSIIFLGIQYLGLQMGVASTVSAASSFAGLVLFTLAYQKLSSHARPFVTLATLILIVVLFKANEVIARQKITDVFHSLKLGDVEDIVLSPLPSHPTCWTFFVVRNLNAIYTVDVGTLSTRSSQAINSCPQWHRASMLRLEDSPLPSQAQITWMGQYTQPLKELTNGYPDNCQLKGWYQFARVPAKLGSLYGDLRFGSVGQANFSTIDLAQSIACPPLEVPWIPPRIKILGTL